METRTINQVKIYKLVLNRMTSSKIEHSEIAILAYSKERLIEFMKEMKVEMYHDGRWSKTFKQGGLLEWFNDYGFESDPDQLDSWGHGIHQEWVNMESNVEQHPLFIS